MVTRRKLSSAKNERQLALDINSSGYRSKPFNMEVRVPQEDKGEASKKDDQQPGTQTGDLCREDTRLSTLSGVKKKYGNPLYEQRKQFSQTANVFHSF